MGNESATWQAVVIWAVHKAEGAAQTPLQLINAVIDSIVESDVTNGKVLISSSEAGGSTSFSVPEGMSTHDLLRMLMRARDYCITNDTYSDPPPEGGQYPEPTFKQYYRARFTFANPTI